MNWLVFHLISGQAFFSGAALLIASALASLSSRSLAKRFAVLSFLVGSLAIVLSSSAIPYWYYGIAGVVTLVWIVSRFRPRWRKGAVSAVVVVWIGAIAFEVPYHLMPAFSPSPNRSITIIGDSITAGVEDGSETWPKLLAAQHELEVQDISHVGETTATAMKRANSHPIESSLVIVEIGGNDLLGSTTTTKFAADLEALLKHLQTADRQILMFELPLPPFFIEYGRIQRSLAARHNVALIPKRVLLSIIAGNGSTLDSIHLTQSGHQDMADSVWCVLQPAFEPGAR
jgi:acyl-CoA thioesterase-1